MSFRRLRFALVLLVVRGPLPASARAQSSADSSRAPHTTDQLIQAFRVAHQKHSLAGVARLVYWGGTSQDMRRSSERAIADDFPMAIVRVTMQPLAQGEMLQYTKNGVTYRPTLRAIGRMKVEFVPRSSSTATETVTSYLVGIKDGVYYLLTAEQVSK